MRKENEVLSTFNSWAISNNLVRAVILTSSRTNKTNEVDFLSDYDIELYVSDIKIFMDDKWLESFGEVMVRWPYKPKSTLDINGLLD